MQTGIGWESSRASGLKRDTHHDGPWARRAGPSVTQRGGGETVSELGVGKIIPRTAETANQSRDAIHVAIVALTAGQLLLPSQHVAIVDDVAVAKTTGTIGIVDPYLRCPVEKGQDFWLFLYPNTVTSLRHEWTHPAFDLPKISDATDSRLWVALFANDLGQTFDGLMDAAKKFQERGDYTYDNSESYKAVDWEKWPEFWRHFERLTGLKENSDESCPFTCSC